MEIDVFRWFEIGPKRGGVVQMKVGFMTEMVLWLDEKRSGRIFGGGPPLSLVGGYKQTSAGGPLHAIFL